MEVVVEDIKKEIIAFVNRDGGKLYIGIRDDGTVAGIDNPDGISLQNSNIEAMRCLNQELIRIYADRFEFVSIGGLMPGIDLEDMK